VGVRRIEKTSEPKWYEAYRATGQLHVSRASVTRRWVDFIDSSSSARFCRPFTRKLDARSFPVRHALVMLVSELHTERVMGKLIRFPVARVRRPAAVAFAAFDELKLVERSQFKLFAAYVAGAAALMGALHLVTG
jgi:hypothetical protein